MKKRGQPIARELLIDAKRIKGEVDATRKYLEEGGDREQKGECCTRFPLLVGLMFACEEYACVYGHCKLLVPA